MRWFVCTVCMFLCVKINVYGASLSLEEQEELAEVNEELAEQNAEGGNQGQSGGQGQIGFQLPGGTFINPRIGGMPGLQAFPPQLGLGSPFRFAQGTYPAILGGGGFPAPRMPAQTFPQAFNPSAGFAPVGLNRAMRGLGDPFLGVNFMPAGGPFFFPYGNGGYSLVPNSYNQGGQGQGQGQGQDGGAGVDGRGQLGVPGDPFLPRPQVPQLPPPGFIDNPTISIGGGPQGEFGPPQGPVPADGPGNFNPFGPPQGPIPADGPGSFIPPQGPLPGDFPGDQPGGFPGSYYPQQGPFLGNFYPQQGPQEASPGNLNPQGPVPGGDGFVPGGFNAQGVDGRIPGIPGTYAPLDPSEYGTQFFNRALQTRLLPSLLGGGQGGQGATSGGGNEGRASQGTAAATDGSSAASSFIMPFNPTILNPYGAPGAFAAPPFNPRGDGFSPFFPGTFNQQQPGAPSSGPTVMNPNQPGTDAFFPFSAADMPPPAAQSNTIAVRELSGRGIPSVAAVAPEEVPDNGK